MAKRVSFFDGGKLIRQQGAALVEFCIVLVFIILPLATGAFTLGRIIWQAGMLSDFAREAARHGTVHSDRFVTATCDSIVEKAEFQARASLDSNPRWGLSRVWGSYVFLEPAKTFRANSASGPSTKIRVLRVFYVGIDDCLFCWGNFLRDLNIYVMASMDINAKSECNDA